MVCSDKAVAERLRQVFGVATLKGSVFSVNGEQVVWFLGSIWDLGLGLFFFNFFDNFMRKKFIEVVLEKVGLTKFSY